MKSIKKIALLAIVLGCVFVLGQYHIVRDGHGLSLVKKEKFGFNQTWVDTRDWTIMDYARNPSISKEKMTDTWTRWKESADDHLQSLTDLFDEALNRDSLSSSQSKMQVNKLKDDAQKQLKSLRKKLEDKEIDFKVFEQEYEKVRSWTTKRIADLEATNN